MQHFLIILAAAVLFFAVFCGALQLKSFFGKQSKRRCACAMSRDLLRRFEERERQALHASTYDPKTVDIKDLPIVDKDI